ncbi:MAG TPA: Ig-like domain-containing protein [Acidimicrobiales bacterium]|nr:Ig-like domain-containing protein [Acidimicrobiales bacterium]
MLGTAAALVTSLAQLVAMSAPASADAANYVFDPNPIAAQGKLQPGASVTVVLTAVDSGGNPVPGATVYLSFTSNASNPSDPTAQPGSATANGTKLTSTPTAFTAGSDGKISIDYSTAGSCFGSAGCGGEASQGSDTITAQNAPSSPTVSATDSYTYGSVQIDKYTMTPTPIAPAGSLKACQNCSPIVITFQATKQDGTPDANATVWASAQTPNGGGSFSTDPATVQAGGGCSSIPTNSPSPAPCRTDSNGQIKFDYKQSSGVPSFPTGGRDVITVQDAQSNPGATVSDEYDYGQTQYQFSPTPIAPTGSLGSSQSVTVTLLVLDSSGQKQAGATVYLSLTGTNGAAPIGKATATNPASSNLGAQANSGALSSTPGAYTTDSGGRVLITYTTPTTTPASGTDVITAQDASSSPSSTNTDSYTYAPAAFVFNPSPIAADGSLGANQSVPVTLTVQSNGQPQGGGTVYLSFSPASGGGSASVKTSSGTTKLTSTPQPFTASAQGTVSITYTAPANPPTKGTDSITAQDAATKPTKTASDVYNFTKPSSTIPQGYWLVGSDGGIFSFGVAHYYGSTGNIKLAAPIVAMSTTPDANGYWFVGADGGVFSFGDAHYWGSTGNIRLAQPVVGMAYTPDGGGYWLVARDGGIFSFGNAVFHGSTGNIKLAAPIVGMAATPDGGGYWFVGSDGGIFSFGDARFHGSLGNIHLNAPIVGMAATPTGNGYWLVAADGGIFTFGDANFFGSTGNIHLAQPIVGMSATPDGGGYWFVARDGGVFSFGDANFFGSMGGKQLAAPIVGMSGI